MKLVSLTVGVCSTQVPDLKMVTLELVNCLKLNRQLVQLVIHVQALELDGLEELRLGGVVLGGTGAVIREFSTDPNICG